MTQTSPSTLQLIDRAYALLLKELGPVDFVRVLQQLEGGHGDYTQERHQWLDQLSLDQVREITKSLPHPSTE